MNTGDYQAAIRDYTTVINEYPKFLYGYQKRAQARRKIGDKRGADKDEEHVIKEQMAHRYGYSTPTSRQKNKTRKKTERSIDDYDKLIGDVMEDADKYESEYRGRVQNRNVEATMIREAPASYSQFDDENTAAAVRYFHEAYSESQTGNTDYAIELLTKAIDLVPSFAEAYFNRGIIRLLLEENTTAIMDLSKAGELGIYQAYSIIKKNQNKRK